MSDANADAVRKQLNIAKFILFDTEAYAKDSV
jgi:hypothetical protein